MADPNLVEIAGNLNYDIWLEILRHLPDYEDFPSKAAFTLQRTCKFFDSIVRPRIYRQVWDLFDEPKLGCAALMLRTLCEVSHLRNFVHAVSFTHVREPRDETNLVKKVPAHDDDDDDYSSQDEEWKIYDHTPASPDNLERAKYSKLLESFHYVEPLFDSEEASELGKDIKGKLSIGSFDALTALVVWICPNITTLNIQGNKDFASTMTGRAARIRSTQGILLLKMLRVNSIDITHWDSLPQAATLENLDAYAIGSINSSVPFKELPRLWKLRIGCKNLDRSFIERIIRSGRLLKEFSLSWNDDSRSPSSYETVSIQAIGDLLRDHHANLQDITLLQHGLRRRDDKFLGNLSTLHSLRSLWVEEHHLFGIPTNGECSRQIAEVIPSSLEILIIQAELERNRSWRGVYDESELLEHDEQCRSLMHDQRFEELYFIKLCRIRNLSRYEKWTRSSDLAQSRMLSEVVHEWASVSKGVFIVREGHFDRLPFWHQSDLKTFEEMNGLITAKLQAEYQGQADSQRSTFRVGNDVITL